jgi:hypothetical protein
MTSSRHLVALAALPLLVAAPIMGAVPAQATPVENGCASGYSSVSVAWLATQGGYRLPSELDSAGNNNGLVCAKAFNETVYEHNFCVDGCTVPVIYNFYEDNLTPLH